MPEKQILLEFLYLDGLENLFGTTSSKSNSYFSQMCLVVNRISNEAQLELLLDLHNVKDCSDWSLVSGKKKVLKFKSSALFSILDSLDQTVDSFCLGEKVLLRKRHYAALYSQLVRKHSPQTDVKDTISSILQFLGIVFENNLIKAYLKANRLSSTKNQIRDLTTSMISHPASISATTTMTATPYQKSSLDIQSDLKQDNSSCEIGINTIEITKPSIKDSLEQFQSQNPEDILPVSQVENEKEPQIEIQTDQISLDQNFELYIAQRNIKQSNRKEKKKQIYPESEVDIFSSCFCLVNTSRIVIKVNSEEEKEDNDEFEIEEEYFKLDEKENFHFNQDLMDYDIADVLSESFKFEPSLCLSKEQIRNLVDSMQQQQQQQQQQSQSSSPVQSSSQQRNQSFNLTPNMGGAHLNQLAGTPITTKPKNDFDQAKQQSRLPNGVGMMLPEFSTQLQPDFQTPFNPQNHFQLMLLMNQQMLLSQTMSNNFSNINNPSRPYTNSNNNGNNSINPKYSNTGKNANNTQKSAGGYRENNGGTSFSNQYENTQSMYSTSRNKGKQQQQQQQQGQQKKPQVQQQQQQQQQLIPNQLSRSKKSGGNNSSNQRSKKFSQMNGEDDSRLSNCGSGAQSNGSSGNSKRTASGSDSTQQQYQRSDHTSPNTDMASSNSTNSSNNKKKQSNMKKPSLHKNYEHNQSSIIGAQQFLPQQQPSSTNYNHLSLHQFSLVPIVGNQLRRLKD